MTRILVTGASGVLGPHILRAIERRKHVAIGWGGKGQVDLTEGAVLREAFAAVSPDVVINAAGLTSIQECYERPADARMLNAEVPAFFARLARMRGTRFVHLSTDLVFDGEGAPYGELDVARPVSAYGRSKLEGERAVLGEGGAIVRFSLLYGLTEGQRQPFFSELIAKLRAGLPVQAFADEWRAPLEYAAAADALVDVALDKTVDLLHVAGPERLSREEIARAVADRLGVSQKLVVATSRQTVQATEPRPRDTTLATKVWRGRFPQAPWPTLRQALEAMKL